MVKSKSSATSSTSDLDVYVKLPSGRNVSFILPLTATIERVCDEVGEEECVRSDRVVIKYTGKVLNRSHSLSYLGVREETILKAEIIQLAKWTVLVRNVEGRTVAVQVENVSTVRTIAVQVEAEMGIKVNKQQLKLKGQRLTDLTQRVMDVGIKNESLLDVKETRAAAEDVTEDKNSAEQELNEEDKQNVMQSFDAQGRRVEVMFCFDTTGSMYPCLAQVREKLRETVTRLISEIPSIRIGIMAHGDYCDYNTYVERHVDLTSDVDQLVEFVDNVPSTGGGDCPECYEWALRRAQFMDWSEDSAKAFVMIGDAVPHPPSYTDEDVFWGEEVDVLAGMGVKIYGVRALDSTTSTPFYEEIAERTGGAYISFTNFSIITAMFLAVCYREANEEQYEDYCQEVMEDGATAADVKADIKDVIGQLDQQANRPSNEQRAQRVVTAEWWSRQQDNRKRPQYFYNSTTDTWAMSRLREHGGTTSEEVVSRAISSVRPSGHKRRERTKHRCTIM